MMKSTHYLLCILFLILMVGVVAADPPKISLVVKPTEGTAPLTIQASEESGDPAIIDYQWDFGDGNRAFHDAKVEHIYEKAGEYKLILTVINEKGEETSDSVTVIVREPEVTPTPEPTPFIIPITPQRIVYEGVTSIKDAIATKSATKSTTAILSEETVKALKDVKYPYDISSSKVEDTKTVVTTFKIQKFRCDEKTEICGYWIEATRDGQEIETNSPIWISPPPYEVVVSKYYDSIAKEDVVTIKEDPKLAIEQILQRYVDSQSLGKAIVGTKE